MALLRRHGGFTVYELMITVAIAGVLASLAAPSFRQYLATQRIRNASYDLVTALILTRSEAINRNATVSLSRSSSNWSSGWIVTPDGGTTVLLRQQSLNGVSIADSASLSAITYGKDGRTTTVVTQFTVSPATSISGVKSRYVCIGLSGLPAGKDAPCS